MIDGSIFDTQLMSCCKISEYLPPKEDIKEFKIITVRKKPIFTNIKKRFEHMELPAKLRDYFLRSNKSNINQLKHWMLCHSLGLELVYMQTKTTKRIYCTMPRCLKWL